MMHAISFDIEEHFQVAAFDCAARRRHWHTQESRVERNTDVILDILDERGVKATMFVLLGCRTAQNVGQTHCGCRP